jgi:hypothetical protein
VAVPPGVRGPVVDSAEALALTDSGICLSVCQALSFRSGATAVLLFVGTETRSYNLQRQLLLLQYFYGPDVWSRVLFVFRTGSVGGSDGEAGRREAQAVLAQGLASVGGVVDGGHVVGVKWPVVLGRDDSVEVVSGKVRWAAAQCGIPTSSLYQFTFGESLCTRCGATNDERMLAALTQFEAHVALGGPLAKCHPGLKVVPDAGASLGERILTGILGAVVLPVMLPVYLLFGGEDGWDQWRTGSQRVFADAVTGATGYKEVCTHGSCGAPALSQV